MKKNNISIALSDYIWGGISPEYRYEVESRYSELSFAVGRALGDKKLICKETSSSFNAQCALLMHRLIENEYTK